MPRPNPQDFETSIHNLDREAELEGVSVSVVGSRVRATPRRGTGNVYPWVWFYDPRSWYVLAGELVPRLISVPLLRGVQNITRLPNGEIDISALIVDQRLRGRSFVPTEWGPIGPDGLPSYCRKIRGMREYVDAWTTPIVGSNRPRCDTKAKAAWLKSLVDSGRLPQCPLMTLEILEEDYRRNISRQRDRYARLPSGEGAINRWRELLAVVVAYREALEESGEEAFTAMEAGTPKLTGTDGKGDAAAAVKAKTTPAPKKTTAKK